MYGDCFGGFGQGPTDMVEAFRAAQAQRALQEQQAAVQRAQAAAVASGVPAGVPLSLPPAMIPLPAPSKGAPTWVWITAGLSALGIVGMLWWRGRKR